MDYVEHVAKQHLDLNAKRYVTVGIDGLQHMCVECKESVGIYTMDSGGMLCYACMKAESYRWVESFFDLAINDERLNLSPDTKDRLSEFVLSSEYFGPTVNGDVQALMSCGEVFYIPKPIESEPVQDSQESEADYGSPSVLPCGELIDTVRSIQKQNKMFTYHATPIAAATASIHVDPPGRSSHQVPPLSLSHSLSQSTHLSCRGATPPS